MRRSTKWMIVALIVVVLAAAAILSNSSVGTKVLEATGKQTGSSQSGSAEQNTMTPNAGSQAPGFQLQGMDGQTVALQDLKGKRVLINFWASWCGPCKEEMPDLEQEYQKYKDQVTFYEINLTDQDDQKNAQKFLIDHDITIPVLWDPDGTANQTYQIRSIPTTFAIGPNGEIVEKGLGLMTKPMMDDMLQKLLAAK